MSLVVTNHAFHRHRAGGDEEPSSKPRAGRRKTEPRYLHPGPTGQPCFHSPQRFRPDKGQQADGRQDRRQTGCPARARRKLPPASHLARCHRLARWWLTLVATRRPPTLPDATGLPGGGSRSSLPAGRPTSPDATGLPGGGSRSSLPAGRPPRPMPPACPVVPHAHRYPRLARLARCHRLARWWLTLIATRRPRPPRPMPPACPVVAHAHRYTPAARLCPMPPACPVVAHAHRYTPPPAFARCHRLARW